MRSLVAAVICLIGGLVGGWFVRDYFGRAVQANIDITEGLNASIASNRSVSVLRANGQVFEFESPCASKKFRRDRSADDQAELVAALTKSKDKPSRVNESEGLLSFNCGGVFYDFFFDDGGRTKSVSIRD